MMDYYWPGNIRELKNVVERIYLYGEEELILPSALPMGVAGLGEEVIGDSFDEKVESFKKKLVLEALGNNDNNQRRAADSLEMSYDQFRHFFKKYK